MFKVMSNYFAVLFLATVLFSSCSDNDSNISSDDFADQTAQAIAVETRSGSGSCFEIVFPLDIEYPDGSVESYDSMEELRDAVKAWKESNGASFDGRPHLVFPIELINSDGELITINDRLELRMVVKECKLQGHFKPCFKIVYPITVIFPEGNSEEYLSRKDLKTDLREWKINNPDSEVRPYIDYPILIEYEDGTQVEIYSKEELKQAKEDCN